MNDNNEKPTGKIEPFNSQPEKNTDDENATEPAKKIDIEPVNKEELSALLSEPTGYADIVNQIRKDTVSQNKEEQQKPTDIPEYDLNKQMLAGHRKNTASRRKGPGQKAPIPIKSIPTPVPTKAPEMADMQKPEISDMQGEAVIREIVARDITRLCRCNRV